MYLDQPYNKELEAPITVFYYNKRAELFKPHNKTCMFYIDKQQNKRIIVPYHKRTEVLKNVHRVTPQATVRR